MRLLQKVAEEDCPGGPGPADPPHLLRLPPGRPLMGLRAIVLARRLRLYSALPAPSIWLPDPDLSEICMPVIFGLLRHAEHWGGRLGGRTSA